MSISYEQIKCLVDYIEKFYDVEPFMPSKHFTKSLYYEKVIKQRNTIIIKR